MCVSVLVSHILYLHIKTLRNEKIVLLFFIYIAIQKDIMILIAREVVAVINFTKTSKSGVYYFFLLRFGHLIDFFAIATYIKET